MGIIRLIGQCPVSSCRLEDRIIGEGEPDQAIKVQCKSCGAKWRDYQAAVHAANRAGGLLIPYMVRLDKYAVQVTQTNVTAIVHRHEIWRWWTEALKLKFRLRQDPTCEVRLIGPRDPSGRNRPLLQIIRTSEGLGLYDPAPVADSDARLILAWSADLLNQLFLNTKDPRAVGRAPLSITKIIGSTEQTFQAMRTALFTAMRELETAIFSEVIYDLVTKSTSVKLMP